VSTWGAASETKLKYVCRIVGGGTPDKENLDFWNGEIPWVSPKDMGPFLIKGAEDHITREAVLASATTMVPPGSVLIVVRSGILRHTLPVGVTLGEFAINQDLKALVPKPGVEARFLAYLIKGSEQ
jgi:type I restriction enzyme S subunit